MCSIMGFTSGTLTPEQFMPFFERTVSRGPDMSRVEQAGRGYLCFHRLAIMQAHDGEAMEAEGISASIASPSWACMRKECSPFISREICASATVSCTSSGR